MTYNDSYQLEGNPTPEQKERLEDFLDELVLLSRRYGILIDGYVDDEQVQILDLQTDTIIGLDLLYMVRPDSKIVAYDCRASILDGVWLVDTPDGAVEQYRVIDAARSRRGQFRH